MKTRQKFRKFSILFSLLLFPITIYYFSPYLIVQGAFSGIVSGSFLLFGLLFFASLFLGRSFCGWVCPISGLGEALIPVRSKRVEKGNWIKYLIWVPWMGVIVTAFILSKGFRQIDPLYMTDHGISIGNIYGYIVYYFILVLIVVLSLTAGKKSFCHHACWISPFMIIGTKLKNLLRVPSLHLAVNKSACVSCMTCTKNCPMSLEVEQMVQRQSMKNNECILCGECVDGCKSKAIRYQFGDPSIEIFN